MTDAPTLSPEALASELAHIHRKRHRTRNTVLLARLSPELPYVEIGDGTAKLRFRVERARCELELRAALLDESTREPAVVLVDWDPGRLPADLSGRIATGAVQSIARSRRIRAAFSNAQVSDELLACRPLVDAILTEPQFRRPQPPSGLVTLDSAWRAWLLARKVLGQETETEATLLARVASEPVPAGLAPYLAQREELRRALDAWLASAVGRLAPWFLRLWLEGKGPGTGALAFVLDALRPQLGTQSYVTGMLEIKLDELAPGLSEFAKRDPQLLERWAELASMLAAQFENAAPTLLRVLDTADRFLPSSEQISEALARSDYLRTALEARKATLTDALHRAAEAPTEETWRAVRGALEALGRHKLRDADPGPRELFERARMAARLVGWLVTRERDVPFGASTTDILVLAERAEDYLRQGSFADFARRNARGSTADRLGAAIQRVVERADARRDQDDAEFARALVTWNEVGRPADRVLPIESALDRFAVRFLRDQPHRKLLVVLLDGMSWANAVELLESLEGAHYAPLRWRVPGTDGLGVPPVLAALPTITDVSRAALFAGQLLRPGDGLDTARDPVRFENHKTLRELGEKPQLLLKGKLQTGSGDVSSDALDLVSSAARVVGVVVNAIDDQLKAGKQTRVAYSLGTIRPLHDLLERATLANRAVLLVADHGHIYGARMTNTLRARGDEPYGARWRALRSGAKSEEGETVIGGSYVWRPQAAERLALLVRETDSYGLGTSEGEHGGASLAEVVAPAILVGSESLAERVQNATNGDRLDPELEVRALARPPWWDLRSPSTTVVPAPLVPSAATSARPRREPEPPSAQIPLAGLMGDATPAPARPAAKLTVKPEPSQWEAFFARSKLLKELGKTLKPEWIRLVEAVAAEGGVLAEARVAQATGIPIFRVGGAAQTMGDVLNTLGTEIIRFDSATRLVHLDVTALKDTFG